MRRGTGTLKVRKPKAQEGGSDVTIRESPDELTLRAEEVNTWKMGPHLVDADWYAFCQALYKGIEGKDWEEMYDSYKEMSKALGGKKPQEAQKAKALWAMRAAEDWKEEYYDLAREEDISRRNKTRSKLWEEHLSDPSVALDKALKCVEDQY